MPMVGAAPAPAEAVPGFVAGTARQADASSARVRSRIAILLLVAAAALTVVALALAIRDAQRASGASDLGLLTERLARSAMQAADGQEAAFATLQAQHDALDARLGQLASHVAPDGTRPAAPDGASPSMLDELARQWVWARRSVAAIVAERPNLVGGIAALRALNDRDAALLDAAERLMSALADAGAPAREQTAAARMALLSQRIAKHANLLLAAAQPDPEAAYAMARDTAAFRELLVGLSEGSAGLRLAPQRQPVVRQHLDDLRDQLAAYQKGVQGVLDRLQGLARGRAAVRALSADSEEIAAMAARMNAGGSSLPAALRPATFVVVLAVVLALAGIILLRGGRRRVRADSRATTPAPVAASPVALEPPADAPLAALARRIREVHGGDLPARDARGEELERAVSDWIDFAALELRHLGAAVQQSETGMRTAGEGARHAAEQLLEAISEQAQALVEMGVATEKVRTFTLTALSSAGGCTKGIGRTIDAATFGVEATRGAIQILRSVYDRKQDAITRVRSITASLDELTSCADELARLAVQVEVVALNTAIRASGGRTADATTGVLAEEVQRFAQRSGEASRQVAATVERVRADCQRVAADARRDAETIQEQTCVADDVLQSLINVESSARALVTELDRVALAANDQRAAADALEANVTTALKCAERAGSAARQTANSFTLPRPAAGEPPKWVAPIATG